MDQSQQEPFSARRILDTFYHAEQRFTNTPADQRDFSVIANLFAEDFHMEQSSALPWAGTYRGPAGLKDWMERASKWVVIDVRDHHVFESKDSPSTVVVLSQIYYICHKTGIKIDFPLSQTIDFDLQNGLIKSIRSYYWDIKHLNEAMGYAA